MGFPCNQFGGQEPGTDKDIKKFAADNYGVQFPMFSKVEVNGDSAAPFFKYLKAEKRGLLGSDIPWNFNKFLVDKNGNVIGRYAPTDEPMKLAKDIEKALFSN